MQTFYWVYILICVLKPRGSLGPAGDIESEGVIGCGIHQAACGTPIIQRRWGRGMGLYGICRGAARAGTPVGRKVA